MTSGHVVFLVIVVAFVAFGVWIYRRARKDTPSGGGGTGGGGSGASSNKQ